MQDSPLSEGVEATVSGGGTSLAEGLEKDSCGGKAAGGSYGIEGFGKHGASDCTGRRLA